MKISRLFLTSNLRVVTHDLKIKYQGKTGNITEGILLDPRGASVDK